MSNLIIDYDLSVQPADDRDTRMRDAAPEMMELLRDLSKAYDFDKSSHDLTNTLYDLRCMAIRLLAKIEGVHGNGA